MSDIRERAIRSTAHFLRTATDWQEGQDYLSNHRQFGPWLAAMHGDDDLAIITDIQNIIREAEDRLGNALPY